MKKGADMYSLVKGISILIRQFIIPNPFEKLSEPLLISIYGSKIELPPAFLNILAEPLLFLLTFLVVGLYYQRGIDQPAKGSLLYLLFYCIHVALLQMLSSFNFSFIAIIIVVVGYVACHVGFLFLRGHFSECRFI